MKTLKVSEAVHAALERLARDLGQTPDDILAAMLATPGTSSPDESIVEFALQSTGSSAENADPYFALLTWVAGHHAAELGEFVRHESGSPRWLGLGREETIEHCRQHHSRQIGRTPYWAILNLEPAVKRRFVFRLMEFIGYSGAAIEIVCAAIGLGREVRRRFRLLVA